ncbi:MAG TPA: BON domain-containing protein [Longimicrobiales bacterium]
MMHREDRDARILTREDIGYGPGRPYEYDVGPAMERPRERRARAARRRRGPAPRPPGEGPYFERLRRRRPDHWIKAEVEEILFRDTWIDADRITVDVHDGVVTLIGMLPRAREVRAALRDARRAAGVTGVRNRLEIEP